MIGETAILVRFVIPRLDLAPVALVDVKKDAVRPRGGAPPIVTRRVLEIFVGGRKGEVPRFFEAEERRPRRAFS